MLAPINRIIVFVGDVQRCVDFYRDTFDLAPVPGSHDPAVWQEMETGGCRIAFHKAYGPDGPIDNPTGGPNIPHKVVFRAEDVPAMREELIRRGAPMGELQRSGDVSHCDGHDPEGHRFQISSG